MWSECPESTYGDSLKVQRHEYEVYGLKDVMLDLWRQYEGLKRTSKGSRKLMAQGSGLNAKRAGLRAQGEAIGLGKTV